MGSTRSRQGSAALPSTRRTSRLAIAALVAMVVALLAAGPAMAASSDVDLGSNGMLTYRAAPGQVNDVTVVDDGSSLTITDLGTDAITILNDQQCHPTGDPKAVACTGADKVQVFTRDLDDTVTLTTGPALISELYGQNGNDTLNGGSGKDLFFGGSGNDILSGKDGDDVFLAEAGGDGDDQMSGGGGSADLVSYADTSGVTVDLGTSLPQDTGSGGMDSFSEIENVNGSTTGADDLTGGAGPNRFIGSGGGDTFDVRGGGSDVVNCGVGEDTVFADRSDAVRFRNTPGVEDSCETVDDDQVPGNTTITDGPAGLTNDPRWEFTSNEPWADFECAVVASIGELSSATWSQCRSGEPVAVPDDGAWILAVRAFDDQGNRDPQTPPTRSFTLDMTAPDTDVQGPSGTTSNPAPEFTFSSNDPNATFVCGFDREAFFECSTSVAPNPPLADGDHFLEVAAIDTAGNRDATPARIDFRVDTGGRPGPGDGPVPNPQNPPQVQQSKIIIGSLVLISGNAVKMSRKGKVRISLTCAGAQKCSGRLSITTAEPVSKRSRKLVTLGSKKFTIAANKKRKITLKFSKRNIRLAKRLKRFKAKALVREIDARGNPRISSRIFILRAR
jgi:hypothetical protein